MWSPCLLIVVEVDGDKVQDRISPSVSEAD